MAHSHSFSHLIPLTLSGRLNSELLTAMAASYPICDYAVLPLQTVVLNFRYIAALNGLEPQMSPDEPKDPDKLIEETKDSIKKARKLLEELKIVQEHEGRVLEDQ